MTIHLPAILMFTRGTRFWHTAICRFLPFFRPAKLDLGWIDSLFFGRRFKQWLRATLVAPPDIRRKHLHNWSNWSFWLPWYLQHPEVLLVFAWSPEKNPTNFFGDLWNSPQVWIKNHLNPGVAVEGGSRDWRTEDFGGSLAEKSLWPFVTVIAIEQSSMPKSLKAGNHGANIIPDRNRCSCVTINIYKPCNACNVSVALVARIWSQNDSWTKVPKGGGAELGRAFLRLPKSKTQWLSAQIWREETQAAAYGDLGDLVSWQIC